MANTPSASQRIEIEDVGDVTVVTLMDRVIRDEYQIQLIGDDLARLVDDLRRRKLLLNFATVEIMSTAMIGKLVWLNEHLKRTDGKLVLCSILPSLMEVFEMMKLNRMLTITRDVQTGLAAF